MKSDISPLYGPFLLLSSLCPLTCHVLAKTSSWISLGRSYAQANPSNSLTSESDNMDASHPLLYILVTYIMQTLGAAGSCRPESTLCFAFKHSFIAHHFIPALRDREVLGFGFG